MLSFELSAIDIVLTVAVITLFILHLAKSSARSSARPKPYLSSENAGILRKAQAPVIEEQKQIEKTDIWKCIHSFGYLRNLPKDASIPNECLTCSRIMECCSKDQSFSKAHL